ncbi:hypothetical protein CDAR_6691, partial [Caerostris darwini]
FRTEHSQFGNQMPYSPGYAVLSLCSNTSEKFGSQKWDSNPRPHQCSCRYEPKLCGVKGAELGRRRRSLFSGSRMGITLL